MGKIVGKWTGTADVLIDGELKTYGFNGVFKFDAIDNTLSAALEGSNLALLFTYNIDSKDFQIRYFGDSKTAPNTGFNEDLTSKTVGISTIGRAKFRKVLQNFDKRFGEVWKQLESTNQAKISLFQISNGKEVIYHKSRQYFKTIIYTWVFRVSMERGIQNINLKLGFANIHINSITANAYLGNLTTIKPSK